MRVYAGILNYTIHLITAIRSPPRTSYDAYFSEVEDFELCHRSNDMENVVLVIYRIQFTHEKNSKRKTAIL